MAKTDARARGQQGKKSKTQAVKKVVAGKKVVAAPSGEHTLAQIGAELLRMPAVLKAVKQSLSHEEVAATTKKN